MSDWIARAVWKLFGRLARTHQPLITFAGPAALLAGRASAADRPPAVRLAGTTLGGAVEDFPEFVVSTFLRISSHDIPAVMRAYADDQMREMVEDGGLRKVA